MASPDNPLFGEKIMASPIHAFLEAVDKDRRKLSNPSDLGRGWIVPGTIASEAGPQVLRLRDLVS